MGVGLEEEVPRNIRRIVLLQDDGKSCGRCQIGMYGRSYGWCRLQSAKVLSKVLVKGCSSFSIQYAVFSIFQLLLIVHVCN